MRKFLKNSWVLGIGTTVIGGVLLSFVLDWIKGVDWLSTLATVARFLVNTLITFLNFELKVWWVLIAVALVAIVMFIIAKVLDAREKSSTPAFLNYTKDFLCGYTWEWNYTKSYDGNYTISNLHPVCSKCGMSLKQDGPLGLEMKCLRCNTTQGWNSTYLTDAQLFIADNIKKECSQK